MNRRLFLTLALGVAAAPAGAQSPATSTAHTPDLSGSWRLNIEKSDDAEAAIAAATGSPYAAGARRERLVPNTSVTADARRLDRRQWLLATAERARSEPLVIEQDAHEVKAGFGDEVRTFYFGREATSQDAGGVKRKTRVSWRGEQLLIEESGEDKTRLSHLYTLLPGAQSLLVVYHLEGGELKKPLDLHLYFDRASAQ